MKPALFLDRDGVINKDIGYLRRIEEFEWISGVTEAIKYFRNRDYYIFVVTNQSGISRGFYNENDVKKIHDFINLELKKNGAKVDEFFYSPYHPDFPNPKYAHLANLRKPNIGMLELASKKWNIDKSRSILIGDKQSDIECAENFGIRSFLFDKKNLYKFVKDKIKL